MASPSAESAREAALARLLRRIAATRPRLGPARLIAIDGPSGSGKSTTALALAGGLNAAGALDVRVWEVEEHYDGWTGLAAGPPRVARLCQRLVEAHEPVGYTAYDWHQGRYGLDRSVAPLSEETVVLLEGVGAGAGALAAYRSLLVWVEAPPEVRLRRAVERDGADAEPHLRAWAQLEAQHFAAEDTRSAADLRLDAEGALIRP